MMAAEFMPVTIHTPYYEKMITQPVSVPWLAQRMEKTYMNNTKVLNEDPVVLYKQLSLKHVRNDDYLEFFEDDGKNIMFKSMFFVFLLLILIHVLSKIR